MAKRVYVTAQRFDASRRGDRGSLIAFHRGGVAGSRVGRKLSDLLRAGLLTPVYHGESGVRTLRELNRSCLAASKDLTLVMNRLKVIYRSWAIPYDGQQVYSSRRRAAWLKNWGSRRASPG